MAKRPPLEMNDITQNLKESSGKGIGAFFPTPPSPAQSSPQNDQETLVIKADNTNNSIERKQSKNNEGNKNGNNESNVVSNITILQITQKDIDDLRELAEKPQTYRLTHRNIEYLKDMAYKLSKESKRGKIGQGDLIRIALLLFDKFISNNKAEFKEILERMK